MSDTKDEGFIMNVVFRNVYVAPSMEATFELRPIAIVCVATCVNCHRTRETKPRWPDETERNVLCAQCRTPYLYSERK